ncbi:MAG: OmpH family outer membrane protein [Marinilabiliaceae bacterium]
MKSITLTLISVLFFLTSGVNAQDQELKFGHANVQEIMQAMPEFREMQQELEGEQERLENQLSTMQEDYQQMEQDYQESAEGLMPQQRQEKEQELMETSQKIQGFYQSTQQELREKQQELQEPIMEKLMRAVEEVGDEGGFIYVFAAESGATVYQSDQSVDVTSEVKEKLGIQ